MPLPRAPRGPLAALAALLRPALLAWRLRQRPRARGLQGVGAPAPPARPARGRPRADRPGAPGRLEAIRQRGVLRCGVRDAIIPFAFADAASGRSSASSRPVPGPAQEWTCAPSSRRHALHAPAAPLAATSTASPRP
jgi:hypothetical protein